jgi:hypothetical protein
MNSSASSALGSRAALVRPASLALLLVLATTACSNHKLTATEAQKLIESSPRFTAPDVVSVRARYCSTINAPADNPASGLGRLKALEGTGAIRVDHRAAAPGECPSTPGPMREWLVISLTDTGFHPRPLPDGAGWEFTRAQRRFLSLGEVSFNSDEDPTIAHATYRWAWRADLLGQLLQVSEDPVNAQATFIRRDRGWELRDVGF